MVLRHTHIEALDGTVSGASVHKVLYKGAEIVREDSEQYARTYSLLCDREHVAFGVKILGRICSIYIWDIDSLLGRPWRILLRKSKIDRIKRSIPKTRVRS